MKKVIVFIVVTVLVLTITPVVIFAKGGPTEKATGYIEYYQPGYYFDFNAHAEANGRPVKGEAWNYTPDGGWYRAEVRFAKSTNDGFLFAAELVETNMPGWGPWVLIKVIDGGTPGTEGDMILGQFLSMSVAINKFNNGINPAGGPWPVLSGNLVVHN